MPATLVTHHSLSTSDADQVSAVVLRAERADGVSPLNDEARLALRYAGSSLHLLARLGDTVVGYAQLERADEQHPSAVLVVDPEHRRAGAGRRLLDAVVAAATAPVGFWSFHALPAAAALADRAGLVRVRELLVMTADVTAPITVPTPPEGISIRTFEVGRDEQAWLQLNAKAFRDHPEQGRLTLVDLLEREKEEWFDPAGFLLATRQETLVGFHWTKQHPAGLGEVYVLAVDPDAGGRGLGKALLAAGLHHLREVGNTTVELYVEAEHQAAVGLYLAHGFTEASRDVMYASR